MDRVNFLSITEATHIVKKFPIEKLVFGIGAGIDSGKPTSLPLGYELTDHILDLACGEHYKSLIQAWNKKTQVIHAACTGKRISMSNRPRLETIIEVIKEFESHQKDRISVIEGLKAFSSTHLPLNREHYILADFLHKGANLVTTNYGDFICKAYEKQYGLKPIHKKESQMHVYKLDNRWSSCIYHIHGISSDLETIGANLSNVKNKLPQGFSSVFNYWLENNYCVIFIGYSGFDTLDVNPFLQSFSNSNSIGVYVRHSTGEDGTLASDKEKALLHPFCDKYICTCITSDFLHHLKETDNRVPDCQQIPNVSWKEIFNKYASRYPEDHSSTLMLGMCYRLGIDITSIFPQKDWLNRVLRCNNVDEWYKIYYSFENAVTIGDRRIVNKQSRLLEKNDVLAQIDIETARGKTFRAIRLSKTPIQLLNNIETKMLTNETVDWNISTSLNRQVEALAFKVLRNPITIKKKIISINKQNILPILIKCNELIIRGGYNFVESVNQINTAHRALALCQVINYGDAEEAEKNINISLNNYADISSINGIASTLLYLSILLLIRYCLWGNTDSLRSLKSNLDILNIIIRECRLLRYAKRFRQIKLLYLYFSCTAGNRA